MNNLTVDSKCLITIFILYISSVYCNNQKVIKLSKTKQSLASDNQIGVIILCITLLLLFGCFVYVLRKYLPYRSKYFNTLDVLYDDHDRHSYIIENYRKPSYTISDRLNVLSTNTVSYFHSLTNIFNKLQQDIKDTIIKSTHNRSNNITNSQKKSNKSNRKRVRINPAPSSDINDLESTPFYNEIDNKPYNILDDDSNYKDDQWQLWDQTINKDNSPILKPIPRSYNYISTV